MALKTNNRYQVLPENFIAYCQLLLKTHHLTLQRFFSDNYYTATYSHFVASVIMALSYCYTHQLLNTLAV